MIAGTAGAIVSVPVSLVTRGAVISAVSNDIVFDTSVLSVALIGGNPDCTVEPGIAKEIIARVADIGGGQSRLRVGLVGTENQAPLGDGNLYRCKFEVATEATPGPTQLSNDPGASSPVGENVPVIGRDGVISIAAAGASLALSAGTAQAGSDVTVTASLRPRGAELSALSTDIRIDPDQVTVVEGLGGAPDCSADPAIGSGTSLDKEVFARVIDADEGIQILRVGLASLVNNLALPADADPIAVFTCRLHVEAADGVVDLQHRATGSTPLGVEVGMQGEPGAISIE